MSRISVPSASGTSGALTTGERTSVHPFFQPRASNTGWNTGGAVGGVLVLQTNGNVDGATFQIDLPRLVSAGTYDFTIFAWRDSNRGIIKVECSIDGAAWSTISGGIDCYAAGGSSLVTTVTGVALAAAGVARIRCTINGKNASGSGYLGDIAYMELKRTGN